MMTLQFETNKPIIIGIDPGDKDTGIAVFSADPLRLDSLMTKAFWPTVGFLNEIKAPRDTNANGTIKGVRLFIEDPSKNKPAFPIESETRMFQEALMKRDEKLQQQALRIFSRRCQNIGANKKLARILIEIAEQKGFRVTPVRPSKKKLTADEFRQKTGWMGKSSQHSRDAARLVFPV